MGNYDIKIINYEVRLNKYILFILFCIYSELEFKIFFLYVFKLFRINLELVVENVLLNGLGWGIVGGFSILG